MLYGCEVWSLTLREERRIRVGLFENSILRRIFGPKKDENDYEFPALSLHNISV